MKNKTCLLFLIYCLWSGIVGAQTNNKLQLLEQYVNKLKSDKELVGAQLSIKLTSAQKNVFSYQSDKSMIPASVQKLLATGLGFLNFGSDHQFETRLLYEGQITRDSILKGRLIVFAGADPTLGSLSFETTQPQLIFESFYQDLKKVGIRTIEGDLCINISYLPSEKVHQTWEWADLGLAYGAGTAALSFAENAFVIKVNSVNQHPDSVSIQSLYPFPKTSEIKKQIVLVPGTDKADIVLLSNPFSNVYQLVGQLPTNGKVYQQDCALQQPEVAFAEAFIDYMQTKGIQLNSTYQITNANLPEVNEISIWKSPTYSEIAKLTNAYSNNVFADMIAKNTVLKSDKKATFAGVSDYFIEQFQQMNLNTKSIKIQDGSGLSRQNVMTCDFLCSYLDRMSNDTSFVASIPKAGTKGTMQSFMINSKNKSNVRLKSGSMTGVMNYAGYIQNEQGKQFCVAVMVNGFTCKTHEVRKKLEQLMLIISQL